MPINSKLLRDTRKALPGRVTQEEIAKQVPMTPSAYARIERGETDEIRSDTLAGICRALHLSADEVLGIQLKEAVESG